MNQPKGVHYFYVETDTLHFGVIASDYDSAEKTAMEVLNTRYPEDSKIIVSISMIAMYWTEEGIA